MSSKSVSHDDASGRPTPRACARVPRGPDSVALHCNMLALTRLLGVPLGHGNIREFQCTAGQLGYVIIFVLFVVSVYLFFSSPCLCRVPSSVCPERASPTRHPALLLEEVLSALR